MNNTSIHIALCCYISIKKPSVFYSHCKLATFLAALTIEMCTECDIPLYNNMYSQCDHWVDLYDCYLYRCMIHNNNHYDIVQLLYASLSFCSPCYTCT